MVDHSTARGQHFLRSNRLASDLVRACHFKPSDLVVEIGAGKGRLTSALAADCSRILAIEKDPHLASGLIRRFEDNPKIFVVAGDALCYPLPSEPFRIFGNIPFGITTALIRRLLDERSEFLIGADLIVQWGAALKRTDRRGELNERWGRRWEFQLVRRIPATAFEPRPSVDAALLSIKPKGPRSTARRRHR